MIVKPKRGAEGRLRDQIYDGNSLLIECEVVSPPSAAGRTVWLSIPPEQVVALMKSARSAARFVRSEPDPTGVAGMQGG